MTTKAVQTEILKNRFKSIAEEMTAVVLQTAFTVYIKETADFGCALVAPDGEVFATATDRADNSMVGLPTMKAIEALAPYRPGDVGIANDPFSTGGLATHLPDVFLWKAIFVEDEVVGYAMSFIHSSDVGGVVPGSIAMSSRDIYHEGLRIPPVRLYEGGVLNTAVRDIIKLNSRIPEPFWGDIQAQIAGLNRGEQRILEVVDRYGAEAVRQGIGDVMDLAEHRARDLLSRIPDGVYRFVDYMERDAPGARPVRIECTLESRGSDLYLDFEGTDVEVRAALNLPTYGHPVHYQVTVPIRNWLRTMEPTIPYNSGMVRSIHFRAPEGTLLHPGPEAACGARYATAMRVHDCILGCLVQAMPDLFPTAGPGSAAIVLVAAMDEHTGTQKVAVAQPFLGGSGARPHLDGVDGSTFGGGGHLANVPNEVLEAEMPILVEEYGLLPGSSAPGEHRGGVGVEFRMRSLQDGVEVATRGLERFHFQPWGVAGGAPGARGDVVLNAGTEREQAIGRVDLVPLGYGDTISFRTPTGGAIGRPQDRPAHLVAADVDAGLLDARQAREQYGVVVDDAGVVDDDATAAERGRRATPGSADGEPGFSYGAGREAHDARWGAGAERRLVTELRAYPHVVRETVNQRVLERLNTVLTATGETVITVQMVEHAFSGMSHD
ncbi:MAG: hydantoinase B/oxoprolinase family protein [Microbacterium sp.]|uniref:hydantoinase B/oxoprolinase family protein n=1 Tax=Microbacterium sp. TaxID=51671 RepID=UPI0039E497C9